MIRPDSKETSVDVDDDCGPEIEDLYNVNKLRLMIHKFALTRPDFDELSTRMIAVLQLVEEQKRTVDAQARELSFAVREGGETVAIRGMRAERDAALARAATAEAERDAAVRDAEETASQSLAQFVEYKKRRNDQFAAYERARFATVAYLLDRAEQYDASSGYRAFIDEIVAGFVKSEHLNNADAGEYDDMKERVDRLLYVHKPTGTEARK